MKAERRQTRKKRKAKDHPISGKSVFIIQELRYRKGYAVANISVVKVEKPKR